MYRSYRADNQLPDKLTFTDKLPMEWLSTAMYTKAALWLLKHDPHKNPRVHLVSAHRYLVLTTEGVDTYHKITKQLVERYLIVSTLYQYVSAHICVRAVDTQRRAISVSVS